MASVLSARPVAVHLRGQQYLLRGFRGCHGRRDRDPQTRPRLVRGRILRRRCSRPIDSPGCNGRPPLQMGTGTGLKRRQNCSAPRRRRLSSARPGPRARRPKGPPETVRSAALCDPVLIDLQMDMRGAEERRLDGRCFTSLKKVADDGVDLDRVPSFEVTIQGRGHR